MPTLPRAAQIYFIVVWSVAALLVLVALLSISPSPMLLLSMLLLLPLMIAAECFEVELPAGDGVAIVTASGMIFCFMIAVVGGASVLVAATGTLMVELFLRRRVFYYGLFNVARHGITCLALYAVFRSLTPEGSPAFSGLHGIVVLGAMMAVYPLVNLALGASAGALISRQPVLQVYRESLTSVTWWDMLTLPLGALLAVLWYYEPWMVVPGSVPLLLTGHAFRVMARARERSRHNAILAYEAQELAARQEQLLVELQQRQDELLRSSKFAALGTLAAGVAHEFNNLLAGLLGFAELGLRSDQVEEKDEALDMAVRFCVQGRSITSGLLTFARHKEPRREPHNLCDAVESALMLLERQLSRAGITLDRHFTHMPYAVFDPGQLMQVVVNLLTNARDAMLAQGGGTIRVSLEQRGGWAELRVRDTGCGIPEELHEQIFQPFMTTKSVSGGSNFSGTGLGLAISYGIIESHGGSIRVESRPGEGATFIVRLPLVESGCESAPERRKPQMPTQLLRVLVIDDDQVVLSAFASMIESAGHAVTAVACGQAALQLFCQHTFDIVVCDLLMPALSGLEVMRRLREVDPQVCLLVVTGQADLSSADLDQLDVAGVLQKPFASRDLLLAIDRALHTRRTDDWPGLHRSAPDDPLTLPSRVRRAAS